MKMTKNEIKATLDNLKISAKASAKKTMLFALAGAFVLTGVAATQLPQSVAQAATQFSHYRGDHNGSYDGSGDYRQKFDADAAAQNLADTFGVDKKAILDYNAEGWKFRDLDRASFIAYISQKPLADVLSAKTVTNTWRDVSDSFGITREQTRTAHQALMSKRLASDLQLGETTVKNLLNSGYHPGDIMMASALSKKSDKTLDNVLGMKKINNSWYDVATSLGLSEQDYRDCRADMSNHFGGGRHDGNFDHNRGEYCGYNDGYGRHNGPRR